MARWAAEMKLDPEYAWRWKPPAWSLLTRTAAAQAFAYGTVQEKNAKRGCRLV